MSDDHERRPRMDERWFQALVEYAPHGIAVLGESGACTYMCPNMERLTGYTPDHYEGSTFGSEVRSSADWARYLELVRGAAGEPIPLQAEVRDRDGSWRWFEIRARNLLEDEAVQGVVLNFHDITDLRETLDRVEVAERHQTEVVRLGQQALRGQATLELVREALETLVNGIGGGPVRGARLLDLLDGRNARVLADTRPGAQGVTIDLERAQAGLALGEGRTIVTPDREAEDRFDLDALRSDRVGAVISTPVYGRSGPFGVLQVGWGEPTEVSEEQISFIEGIANVLGAAVSRAEVDLEIARAEEDERRIISEGIHDDPLQVMVAAKMRLELARDAAREERPRAMLEALDQEIGAAIHRLRQMIFDLHPVRIEEQDLREAVDEVLREAAAEASFTYEIVGDLDVEPGCPSSTLLFRVVQEAVVNIRKHAVARHVRVTFREVEDRLEVVVVDDGVGFDPASRPGGHLGLVAMQQRVERVGGSFEIRSVAGQGTSVRFRIPRLAPVAA